MDGSTNMPAATTSDIAVEVTDLSKSYGSVRALRNVDLTIQSGEYFVLLGPSGGGKTTLLRLIGGFIRPTGGRVYLHGRDVSDLPPNKRPTSMVFQSYALFPHMNVAKNVGYGLRLKRMPAATITEKVAETLEMVGLSGYDARMPHELSGGQQQRVQLARAMVLESDILLLDEPLAALDAKLRKDMCFELKHLQEMVGITFIHVTHNQEEAMTVADRIALIADGELVEHGRARDIYKAPQRRFTADFIGENNLFDGKIASVSGGQATIDLGIGTIAVPTGDRDTPTGHDATLSVRSESMRLLVDNENADDSLQTISATYHEEVYLGLTTWHMVTLPDGREVNVRAMSDAADRPSVERGTPVTVGWRTEDGRLHLN